MEMLAENNRRAIFHTYKRNYKRMRIFYGIAVIVSVTFFLLKFFSARELKINMKVTEYINQEMDRILKYETRDKQNEEFRNLKPKHPIEPIRMTLSTAVFKYTGMRPSLILKRVIHNPTNNLNEDFMSEGLRSPHICKAIKSFRTKRVLKDGNTQVLLWIFFEFLDTKVSQKSVSGDETMIRKIITDAMRGLQYMHNHNIAHLDLKIGNIMGKSKGKEVTYKLIDFGYSQLMPSTGFVVIPKKNYGTYPYKSPEIVFRNEHGLKSDIWSLGAICWFLSLQYTPFYFDGFEKDLTSYRRFLKKRSNTLEEKDNHKFIFGKDTSNELKDFVKLCMQLEPENRPTVKKLFEHPFILGKKLQMTGNTDDELPETQSYDMYSTSTEQDS